MYCFKIRHERFCNELHITNSIHFCSYNTYFGFNLVHITLYICNMNKWYSQYEFLEVLENALYSLFEIISTFWSTTGLYLPWHSEFEIDSFVDGQNF